MIVQRQSETRVLQEIDKNKDGKLSEDEVRPEIWSRLARNDSDGDAKISLEELPEGRRGQCARAGLPEEQRVFRVRENPDLREPGWRIDDLPRPYEAPKSCLSSTTKTATKN